MNVRQKKFDAALAAVAAIEKKQPDKPLAHDLRGSVLLAKQDVAGARQSFERALVIDPAYFPAAANLARLDLAREEAGGREEALRRGSGQGSEERAGAPRGCRACALRPEDRRTKSPR